MCFFPKETQLHQLCSEISKFASSLNQSNAVWLPLAGWPWWYYLNLL